MNETWIMKNFFDIHTQVSIQSIECTAVLHERLFRGGQRRSRAPGSSSIYISHFSRISPSFSLRDDYRKTCAFRCATTHFYERSCPSVRPSVPSYFQTTENIPVFRWWRNSTWTTSKTKNKKLNLNIKRLWWRILQWQSSIYLLMLNEWRKSSI